MGPVSTRHPIVLVAGYVRGPGNEGERKHHRMVSIAIEVANVRCLEQLPVVQKCNKLTK